jgi:hypothetical protein
LIVDFSIEISVLLEVSFLGEGSIFIPGKIDEQP